MFYTYLIGWVEKNKWYYGVRDSKGRRPDDDLWVHYFTSSKHVKRFAMNHGKPDIIEVRKIHGDRNKAISWEYTVLRRMKVAKSEHWLNKAERPLPTMLGLSHSEETKELMRQKHLGLRVGMLGKKHSEETKAKMRERAKEVGARPEVKKARGTGRRAGFSAETLKRINQNPEKIRKTAEKNRGKKRTPEQRERIRQGALNRRNKMKEFD